MGPGSYNLANHNNVHVETAFIHTHAEGEAPKDDQHNKNATSFLHIGNNQYNKNDHTSLKQVRKTLKASSNWSKLVSSVPSIPSGNKMVFLADDNEDEERVTDHTHEDYNNYKHDKGQQSTNNNSR